MTLPLNKVIPGVEIAESDLRAADANGRGVLRVVRGTYDVSGGDSGATGAHDLRDEDGNIVTIPANAVIVAGGVDVQTTFTDGGDDDATIAIEVDDGGSNDDDIVTAVAIATGTPWDAGRHAVIPDWATAADWIKVAQERRLRVTVAVDDLTAGKMTAFLVYFGSE